MLLLQLPLEQNTIEVLPGIEILNSFNMNGVRVQDDELFVSGFIPFREQEKNVVYIVFGRPGCGF